MEQSQRLVSEFSAVNIGLKPPNLAQQSLRLQFQEEARKVTDYLQGVHHTSKLGHPQVNYSETVNKLSKINRETLEYEPRITMPRPAPQPRYGSAHETLMANNQERTKNMNEYVKAESKWNQRKRAYNKEVGRVAVVNKILSGTAPLPSKLAPLFPVGASHLQILALTNSFAAPDARKPAPPLPKQRKWLGEGVGWGPTPPPSNR